MIANTYVVQPFGISEVKVIALKGDMGYPTQVQVNNAVTEYFEVHPDQMLPTNGTYPEMAVGQLLSTNPSSDLVPYYSRISHGIRVDDEIVGGSLPWNQLCNSSSVTVTNGHKYLLKKGTAWSIGASTGSAITGLTSGSDMVIDLTLLCGSTIADYIYSLEQGTAGAGVAFFRSLFGKDYYQYDAGSMQSVQVAGRKIEKTGEETITYPLDSSLVLRGKLMMDADHKLYFGGDTYKSNGDVGRNYAEYTIPANVSLTKIATQTTGWYQYAFNPSPSQATAGNDDTRWQCDKMATFNNTYYNDVKASITSALAYPYGSGFRFVLNTDSSSTAKSMIAGMKIVYPLATPTTESADPFTNPQVVYDNGTETYLDGATRDIDMPVGHNSLYYPDMVGFLSQIPEAPSANGTYTLKVTVSGGVPTYSWVSG